MNQQFEALRKKCSCGYDPRDGEKYNSAKTCSETKALCNHITFPSANMMSIDCWFSLSSPFDVEKDDRHYACLFEFSAFIKCGGLSDAWLIHNAFGESFILYFYKDYSKKEAPVTFSVRDIAEKNTLAMLNPQKANQNIIVNYKNYENCFIFKSTLKNVHAEADRLLKDAEMTEKKELSECFECGLKANDLKYCSKCKLARYCSALCQRKSWFSVHNKLCDQSDMLLRLAILPRHKYKDDEPFCFKNDHDYRLTLPPYVPCLNANADLTKNFNVLGSCENMSPRKIAAQKFPSKNAKVIVKENN